MQCPSCGVNVVQEAVYCHKCGQRLGQADDALSQNPAQGIEPRIGPAEAFRDSVARHEQQDEPEREIWRGGYSSKAMIGGWAISVLIDVVLLIIGIFFFDFGMSGWLVMISLMLLPWLYHFLLLCYRRMSVRYMLSTQKFVHETGILRRVTDRIEVLDMDDISFEQGPLERLVGVGTIRIVSSDRSHPELLLLGLENARRVSEQFDDARRTERRRRGLHIEQI